MNYVILKLINNRAKLHFPKVHLVKENFEEFHK